MRRFIVLIVDDHISVHESLRSYLNADGIDVLSAFDGIEALETVRSCHVDLVVLDIMMPKMDGNDVCAGIRRISDVPIIMLSAKTQEDCRIAGLELGADDYVTKPFSPRELALKIRRLISRTSSPKWQPKALRFQELSIFPESFETYVDGNRIILTPKETLVLSYLVSSAGKVLSREQIMNAIWGYDNYCDIRVVDTVIKRIRQKLPSDGMHFAIQSVYGVGYKLGEIQ